jgi:hypothetical protein
MKFQQRVTVTGIKRSQGEFEGKKYDSTKFYISSDLDDSKGNAKGSATSEYSLGDSRVYEQFAHLPFPFDALVDMEISTTGKADKILLLSVKPLDLKKAA